MTVFHFFRHSPFPSETTSKTENWGLLERLHKFDGGRNKALMDALLRKDLTEPDQPAMDSETAPAAPPVVFSMGPEEEPTGSHGNCSLWSLLDSWAACHEVDADLVLLICACAAANVAGPRLDFDGMRPSVRIPAPTVISTAGDTRFHGAVLAAIESLYPIQCELVEKYGELMNAPLPKKRRLSASEAFRASLFKQYEQFNSDYKNPAKGMIPDTQRNGPVLFVLEGKVPAKPVKFLKKCHLYSALSVAEIEELPLVDKSRRKRISEIATSMAGRFRGKVTIRGFMRFTNEDLEWMVSNTLLLLTKTLPVESLEVCKPVALASKAKVQEFDRLHRTVLRRILELRFSRADCGVDFRCEETGRQFQKLRECYRAEDCAVSHLDRTSVILPDLFVWYLLQLNKSEWLEIDEMEIAEHAIAVARRLRRRVAGFYDRQYAVTRARKRLALATKLVARMQRLAKPCTRRELARGFDDQRIEVIGPVIDWLVSLGVFSKTRKQLSLCVNKEPRVLELDDFMEPLRDVPYSLLCRLDRSEEYQAELRKSKPNPKTD